MKSQRSKQHHFNPCVLLRGFASADGLTVKHDLRTGLSHPPQPVRQVAKQKNFYTVTGPDGQPSSVVEDYLAQLESKLGLILRDPDLLAALSPGQWKVVTEFIAYQHLRVPAIRAVWDRTEAEFKLLRPYVEGLPASTGGREGAVHKMVAMAGAWAAELAKTYVPIRVTWPKQSLLTSDTPVLMIPDIVPVGLSLGTARGLFLAVNHCNGILLWNTNCYPAPRIREFEASRDHARELNRAVVGQSLRQIIWHPDSNVDNLFGRDFAFPPERVFDNTPCENTQGIARALQWHSANPSAPHPFENLPTFEPGVRRRPLSASRRRALYASGFFD